MTVTAIVGANWGDEGKGKVTDVLAAKARYVVRYQGGSNAGHTIINQFGKFALHLLPSGVFYPQTVNVIGPGVALNIDNLLGEIDQLLARGVPEPKLCVSDRAQIVLPYHIMFDSLEEERLEDRRFGSTKQGIAPFYADKYVKRGIQVTDLYNEERLRAQIEASLESKNVLLEHLYKKPPIDAEEIISGLLKQAERLKPYVCDTTTLLHNALEQGEQIVVEGQLGALRDPDHGIYPYSTSSSTLAGFAAVGAGVPPHSIKQVVTVVKAYSSCVGEGPFVSEINGTPADELRTRGGDAGEFGATTGRPRRMGWFDAVATGYGCMLQGTTEIALTNLDVLGYLDEIPVCTAYRIDGEITDRFPVTSELYRCEPVLELLPGWKTDISNVRQFSDLPVNAQNYVLHIEKWIGKPVRWVSIGPKREQMIER
ncbi:adenylosuccinate synthase [Paenibacillus radicis (ex Xue et al. 2023)]|uniref:Adenylosuccinate synthetase n=1 Tax=Paenibacillus radicis (ex Xue et al. 2023) TaxID=2972489 RepID=A0ABT1YC77_9BACL|nr:adenylosuccinate synthase [Paenibacillus radicis (ex Xue et al. 2023)]MCR8629818.1 adenylosuccinate synthase [Paenibacillus radicis (ex Xue et al. 2023)]